jgi:LasA protease
MLQELIRIIAEGWAYVQPQSARRLMVHPHGFLSRRLLPSLTVLVVILGVIAACSPSQPATPPATQAMEIPASSKMRYPEPSRTVVEGTPLSEPTPSPTVPLPPTPTPAPYVHIVQAGENLGYIAYNMGCTVKDLIQANDLEDPNSIEVGQRLVIPSLTLPTGPYKLLLPDSEFVYGPAYLDFDVGAFCAARPGYLGNYEEEVEGQMLSGPEVVELVAQHYSVGPRLLLAVLELKSGWVDDPAPGDMALEHPLGRTGEWQSGLLYQLAWAANQLNEGYYDWKERGRRVIHLADWSRAQYDPGLNAATAGVQYFLAYDATWDQWQALCSDGSDSFIATYRQLFGDPFARPLDPVVPPDVEMPELRLPWENGQTWYLTAGPHGGWNNGSAWAALDFAPPGKIGCQMAEEWVVAAASGLVVRSEKGVVMQDLDGDGHEETGWNLLYMHVATEGRVPIGTMLEQGQQVGHPSCEAGLSTASHVHLARKYNGEWIPADGSLPMILSGWRAHLVDIYEGTLTKGDLVRTACECREDEYNGIRAE